MTNPDDNRAAAERRAAFILDIVEVCRKHKVMIHPTGDGFFETSADDVDFVECDQKVQYQFIVSLSELEDESRQAVWPCVFGKGES